MTISEPHGMLRLRFHFRIVGVRAVDLYSETGW